MEDKTDEEIFLEHVPAYGVWYKIIIIYIYHMIIFILTMVFFWWISLNFLIGVILVQFIISSGANVPFIYMFKNSNKIREKYSKKDDKSTWQHFFFHYSYTSPLGCAALYTPFILKTDYFLPSIISLPSNFITNSLFPVYIALPLGIVFIIFGILLAKHAQGYDGDMHSYLHIMVPKRSKIVRSGIYKYIRHPRFLCRLVTAIGIGIIANNLLALGVVLIHFIPYYTWMATLDKEPIRMPGMKFEIYQNEVPALFPRYGNWKKFIKLLFT